MKANSHIFIKNIYYMLAYVFTDLHQDKIVDVAGEAFENIYDLFTAILALGIGRQLKQGLYLEYVEHRESLPVLRGKLDLQGTIRNRIAQRQQVACEYDELSEDILFNQILKAAMVLLLRQKSQQKDTDTYKDMLRKDLPYFAAVRDISLLQVPWGRLQFQRNNRSYRLLLGVCQLLAQGMVQNEEDGTLRLDTFKDQKALHYLYEKFILNYFRKHWPELNAGAPEIKWALDDEEKAFLPMMLSDVMLEYKDRTLILDAKFYSRTLQYSYDRGTVHSHNLYQVYTYVKNYQDLNPEKKVDGMLLYAHTDEAVQPNVSYRIHGNTLSVGTLDLGQEFEVLRKTLDDIAVRLKAGA